MLSQTPTGQSTRLFLVTPLDTEPPVVPENAQIVRADSLDTLTSAQARKEVIQRFVRGELKFCELKQHFRK